MISLDYLKEFFNDQLNIIVDLNISLKNMQRLKEDVYEFEAEYKRHGFFQHHWYQLRFISIVQLAKLFSQSESHKRSFFKLCHVLRDSPYEPKLKDLINTYSDNLQIAEDLHLEQQKMVESTDDISLIFGNLRKSRDEVIKWQSRFRSRDEINSDAGDVLTKMTTPPLSTSIKRVIDSRDKIYAHKDNNVSIEYVTMEDLESLVHEAGEIYNHFNGKFFGVLNAFENARGWEIEYVLKRLSVLSQKNREEIERIKIERSKSTKE